MVATDSAFCRGFFLLALLTPSIGCAVSKKNPPPTNSNGPVTIQLTPLSLPLGPGSQQQFTATSVADTTKSATATVTVQGMVSIAPTTVGLNLAATQQFSVAVQGQSNPVTTWSVDGINGGNSSVGTINAQGLYTAPSQIGDHTIAANVASAGSEAAAAVTVLSLSIAPAGTLLAPGGSQQFSANIQGVATTGVTWSVDGTAGGNTSVGTISASGVYTAPNAIGEHTVSVSSVAFPSVVATSNLTIQNTAPGAVLTYHNDDARDGAFTQETTLTSSVVNSSQDRK